MKRHDEILTSGLNFSEVSLDQIIEKAITLILWIRDSGIVIFFPVQLVQRVRDY